MNFISDEMIFNVRTANEEDDSYSWKYINPEIASSTLSNIFRVMSESFIRDTLRNGVLRHDTTIYPES